jgi:aspartate/methionine/tyrosine aminotransferase
MSTEAARVSEKVVTTFAGRSEIAAVRQLVRGLEGVIDLGYGEVNFDTPVHIREAAKQALDKGFTKYALPPEGIHELRVAIADKLRTDNSIVADPETEILVTVGGQLAINLVMQAVLNPGDEVILPDPCFMAYPPAVLLAGGVPRFVPVAENRQFRADPAAIRRAVSERTRLIVLVSPDNPTGACLTREDLETIGKIAKDHNLLVVSDEIYEKFVFDGRVHVSLASLPGMHERTITLNGFSKSYAMTGWRVGYAVATRAVMDQMKRLHTQYVLTITSFVQKGAVAALRQDQEPVRRIVEEYAARRRRMVDGLNSIPGIVCEPPAGSFYVWPSIRRTGLSSLEFASRMATDGKVLLYPGTAFGPGGEGCLRISLSVGMAEIDEAIERMRRATAAVMKAPHT